MPKEFAAEEVRRSCFTITFRNVGVVGATMTSEIAAVLGLHGVPLLPHDSAVKLVLIAAISARTTRIEAAHALIDLLLTSDGEAVRRAAGLRP